MPADLRAILPDLRHRSVVMGILNVTPDSFSDGGRYDDPRAALDRALQMMDAGADLIDVGGESTRPGAAPVDADQERGRVLPVIELLSSKGIGPISIDTTKAAVARDAIAAGAGIVNDISAMRFDAAMPAVVNDGDAAVILMHTRGRPDVMQKGALDYDGGVVNAVIASLKESIQIAHAAGIPKAAIALDPGIGFGKDVTQNLELLVRLPELVALGYPVLVGPSRKSFIGKLTGREPNDRVLGTAAAVALALFGGARLIRVHDVKEMVDVAAVVDAANRVR